ncbi:MAG TPA: molybdopterin cofactor-binding domain-containing protein [Vicinamibacterales bacterium]|jgi:CO/xanthine dehydrogenase Mo-binding subunit|nr:molybdopterin cofactor-binding domain-containing protein [Vicinamibacterales bacterium]
MISRRAFLKTASGALVVSFSAADLVRAAQGPFDTHASHVDPAALDSWLAIGADGIVTVHTGKCELGQGILTAQTQLVAEELSVPLDRIRMIQCDTDVCPDQGTTSGSQSTPTNFNQRNLAQAAATARDTLLQLASARLGVPADQLMLENGAVRGKTRTSSRVALGDLVAGRKLNVKVDPQAKRRPPTEWKVLGQPAMRVDMAAMATGVFEFVHNVHVPGMLYGAVVRPPHLTATLAGVDEAAARSLPGLIKVVVKKDFVGVVCEKPWLALQAAARLKVTWTPGPPLPAQRTFHEDMRRQPSRDAYVVNSGDVDKALGSATTVLKATYRYPYQMHGSMGASCAVADVRGDKATVWSPTQSAYPTRSGLALLLGIPIDNVRVIWTRGSGCYGINAADTVSYDAALLSQAAGRPVRVQLSRRDEMISENYGFAYVIDERVGLDASGAISVWDHESWNPSKGGRPGYDRPGNVITGMLAGFEPQPFTPRRAAEPAGEFRNGSNAAPSYVIGRVGAKAGGTGTVASERVLAHTVDSLFFTGPLRSPSRLQNTFAHECMLDEIAAHVKADPVAYRLRHLRDERLKAVLSAAARAARWDERPSPKPNPPRTGPATGRGVSCVFYEGDNGYVAMVAEVRVDQDTGRVTATRFFLAQDCGPVSNPDGMRNQLEGGALQGLSRALGEEVTWNASGVTSIDWRTYHSLPLGAEVPSIESVLIDPKEGEAMGAGETAITIVAAAVGNAIFDATGARIREAPFTPERVKAALAARA